MNKYLYTLILTLLFLQLHAQDKEKTIQRTLTNINQEQLKEHVKVLSSDSLEGRMTTSEGEKKAARYIRNHFRSIGLQSLNNYPEFTDAFQLIEERKDSFFFTDGKHQYWQGKEALIYGHIEDKPESYPLVFIGDGRPQFTEGINFKDKAVLVFGENLRNVHYKEAKQARQTQAALIIAVNPWNTDQFTSLLQTNNLILRNKLLKLLERDSKQENKYPLLYTSIINLSLDTEKVKEFTGLSTSKLLKRINETQSFEELNKDFPNISCRVNIKHNNDTLNAQNVIGYLPAKNKDADWIVICAHYDHLGKTEERIYHGADDNASGTAAVMELARTFKELAKQGTHPSKNILFIAFTGEESGLLGSKLLSSKLCDSISIKRVINLDMIGRPKVNGKTKLYYISNYNKEDYLAYLDDVSKKHNIKLDTEKYRSLQWLTASDQFSFVQEDIPSSFFFTGLHEDYHKPSDTWDKLDYKHYTEIVRFVAELCLNEFYELK
jgi:hypothetical protein